MQDQIKNLGKLICYGATASWALAAAGFSRNQITGTPAGYYIYLLVDPRDDKPFYVGKGKGQRALHHEIAERKGDELNKLKAERLRSIRSGGFAVDAIIVCDGLGEKQALALESLLIREAWDVLTNIAPYKQSAVDRLHAQAQWSLSVFDAVDANRPPVGADPVDWAESVKICKEMAKSCRRILSKKLVEQTVRVQERQFRAEIEQGKQAVQNFMVHVDAGLTDIGLDGAISA